MVDHVTYGYARRPVLHDILFTVTSGEIVSLLGPNGSGKTTLLKLLLGFYQPETGEVRLDGRPVSSYAPKALARRMAYVPQVHHPVFGYRVLDVVLMGRMPHKRYFFHYSAADEKIALDALARLNIVHLRDRSYTQVSGGERQLILIARALAQGADIFVMDEPINGLDYGNQLRLLTGIADLAEGGYTFIKTTHFPDHALWVSDRAVMLKAGRVVADGATASVVTRDNLYNLYRISVDVITLQSGRIICVPKGIQKHSGCRSYFENLPSASMR